MAKILEGSDRIAQVHSDALADVGLNALSHEQEAGGRQPGGDDQHGKQEARAQAATGHKSARRLSRIRLGHGFRGKVHGLADEFVPHAVNRTKVHGAGWVPF